MLLSEAFTRGCLANDTAIEDWSIADAAIAAIQGKVNRAMSLPWLPLGPLRKFGARRWQRLRGCNFSAFRTDIERVNGFDECFQGWGFEDSDFAARLIESGVRLRTADLQPMCITSGIPKTTARRKARTGSAFKHASMHTKRARKWTRSVSVMFHA